MLGQGGCLADPVHADDQAEPAAAPRLHPGQGVLNDRGPRRRRRQPPGGLQEQRRVGLAGQPEAVGLDAVDLDVEQTAQPGRLQHGDHVAAGRHGRGPQPLGPQPAQERRRGRERLGAVVAQVGEEVAVLGVAEPADRLAIRRVARVTPGQVDAPGAEEPGHAVVARPAVDVAKVVDLGERPERLLPARRARYSSNSRFQAAACTLAVSVRTPSVSNTTASRRSRRRAGARRPGSVTPASYRQPGCGRTVPHRPDVSGSSPTRAWARCLLRDGTCASTGMAWTGRS